MEYLYRTIYFIGLGASKNVEVSVGEKNGKNIVDKQRYRKSTV